jgi:hypothetical protein
MNSVRHCYTSNEALSGVVSHKEHKEEYFLKYTCVVCCLDWDEAEVKIHRKDAMTQRINLTQRA